MFYNLHTHKSSGRTDVTELINRYPTESAPHGFYSIGIHPWYINQENVDEELRIVEQAMLDPNCLAVGECGLDKRIETPMPFQEEVFMKQLQIAERHQKPVVLHCVAAYQEAIEIRNRLNMTVPMIIHGFSKNKQTAEQLLKNGFYLSFGKYLLRNPDLKDAFISVPDDRLFLETDTIEESIDEVYERAASYKNISVEEMAEIVGNNFRRVFNLNNQNI